MARYTTVNVQPDGVLQGDIASHKFQDLDPRPVSRVEDGQIWLSIGESEIGPYPAENYRIKRFVPIEE